MKPLQPLSHRTALLAGLALIFGVNAIALGGVYWNRGAEDSRLRLTQRELYLPTMWQDGDEDPGMLLQLRWQHEAYIRIGPFDDSAAPVGWLDARKLAELGFDVSTPSRGESGKSIRTREKDVFLVLELDGPAYIHHLDELRKELRRVQAKAAMAGKPGDPVAEAAEDVRGAIEAANASIQASRNEVREAAEELRKAVVEESHLFTADAGLDPAALRAKYPDRRQYAIVRAVVSYSPRWNNHVFEPRGGIYNVLPEQINLPKSMAESLGLRPRIPQDTNVYYYDIDVAFGRKLEPWIVGARRGKAPVRVNPAASP